MLTIDPSRTALLREACIDYLKRRGQMGSRKAAAHVIHEFGVTAWELSEYLADYSLVLAQGADTDSTPPDAEA